MSILKARSYIFITIFISSIIIIVSTSSIPILVGHNFRQLDKYKQIRHYDTIVYLSIAYFLRALFKLMRNQLAAHLGNYVVMDIRMHTVKNIISSNKSNTLKDYTILTYDLNLISDILSHKTFIFIEDLFTLLVSLFAIAKLSFPIFLIILPFITLLLLISRWYAQKSFYIIEHIRKDIDLIAEKVYENIKGQSIFRTLNINQYEIDKFNHSSKKLQGSSNRFNNYYSLFETSMQMIAFITLIICFIVAGLLTIDNKLEISSIIVLVNYLMILISTSKNMGQMLHFYADSRESIKRVSNYMLVEQNNSNGKIKLNEKNISIKSIRLNDVSLNIKNSLIFNEISVELHKGTINTISGEISVGKTTFCQLILYFFPEYTGSIYINETNIHTIDIFSYYSRIGYVPQNSTFFSTSLRDNILMGRTNISDSYFYKVLNICGLSKFIKKLDLKINKDSNLLSGGERQKFALARALLGKPEILILDDCLNAIDSNNLDLILKNIHELKQDLIIIIISNLKNVLLLSDNIFTLSNGNLMKRIYENNEIQYL